MPSPNPQRELIVLLDEQLDALQKECFGAATRVQSCDDLCKMWRMAWSQPRCKYRVSAGLGPTRTRRYDRDGG
jgi:hypothetical protein